MTTTTGDPSSLKTPATLSGGDLVSRLLAATPPYLYNVPLTPHSFFFSEMLRSFVQTKSAETGATTTTSNNNNNSTSVTAARRRKRSWRDARERPLELTTKDKTTHQNQHSHHSNHHHQHQQQQHHHHTHQQQHQQKDKYYPIQQQQQQETHVDNRFKSHGSSVNNESSNYPSESTIKRTTSYEQKSTSYTINEQAKIAEENRTEFCKQNRDFYDDSSRRFSSEQSAHQEAMFAAANQRIKPEEPRSATPPQQQRTMHRQTLSETNNSDYTTTDRTLLEERAKIAANQELSFLADQKTKLQEFAGRNFLPGIGGGGGGGLTSRHDEQTTKNFGLTGINVPTGTDNFLPAGPALWYPPYPSIAQTYPGIDPLHFFIDLRVSGHIWDRKMNENNSRQLSFKSKHCSAFSVPQAKEYNRPLDLTRDEMQNAAAAAASSSNSSISRNTMSGSNQRGTHFILRNLTETYKEIREMEKNCTNTGETTESPKSSSSDETSSNKDYQGRSLPKSDISVSSSSSSRDNNRCEKNDDNDGKDIRALIGLELVVDYVKEPKEDPSVDEEKSPDTGE